jgi:glycosyltransferase involved in cell wall biosynthesis
VKLSILMPVYNEAATLETALERVLAVDYPCDIELVAVDDGSADATGKILAANDDPRLSVHTHAVNRGKGAAIATAVAVAVGDYVMMCDADLEYAPEEIPRLLGPIMSGEATVVYGTRTFGSHNAYSYLYVLGNKGVTLAANLLFNVYISDLETCFKLVPTQLWRSLDIRSLGFGMEAEVTGKLLRRGIRPYEVPITYKDGVEALAILARERVRTRP